MPQMTPTGLADKDGVPPFKFQRETQLPAANTFSNPLVEHARDYEADADVQKPSDLEADEHRDKDRDCTASSDVCVKKQYLRANKKVYAV